MRCTYHTKPLLDFVNKHGNTSDPEHRQLRANLQSALDCNAANVLLTSEEHALVVRMEIESRNKSLTLKEPANDNPKDS